MTPERESNGEPNGELQRRSFEIASLPVAVALGGERRLDAEAYLSEGFMYRQLLASEIPSRPLVDLARVWQPSRLKGIRVAPAHGVPFLTATQVFDLAPRPRKWLAPSQTPDLAERYVQAGSILVTCSGNIGDTIIAYAAHHGIVVSHDLLRVHPEDGSLTGYLYTFLRTRYGRGMMRSTQYGNVIKHMEPEHLQQLIVPLLGDPALETDLQERTAGIYRLRDEAFTLERAAEEEFANAVGVSELGSFDSPVTISATALFRGHRRLDGYHYNAVAQSIIETFTRIGKTTLDLGRLTDDIILPNRFARGIPLESGLPFVDMEELFKVNPVVNKFLPPSMRPRLSDYYVKKGWLLLARSGQIYGLNGSVVIADEWHEDKVVSEHAIRIIPHADMRPGYLRAAIGHPRFGRPLILRYAFGTSVPEIDPQEIQDFPVVRLGRNVEDSIADKMERASMVRAKAKKDEDGAIRLLEQRIAQRLEKATGHLAEGAEGGPVKINLPFDEAIRRALTVAPPQGGWKALDRSRRSARSRKRRAR